MCIAYEKFSIFAPCFVKKTIMHTRLLALFAVLALAAVPAAAQEEEKEDKKLDFKINIALDTRLDGQVTAYSASPDKGTELGFGGKFITLVMDGAITSGFQ